MATNIESEYAVVKKLYSGADRLSKAEEAVEAAFRTEAIGNETHEQDF
jgi:hypothetical protein